MFLIKQKFYLIKHLSGIVKQQEIVVKFKKTNTYQPFVRISFLF